jgi:hypothetical protein
MMSDERTVLLETGRQDKSLALSSLNSASLQDYEWIIVRLRGAMAGQASAFAKQEMDQDRRMPKN